MHHLCSKCQRPATHAQHNLCDKCWVLKYSTQYYNGKSTKYTDMFKESIGEMGKQKGESREDWFKRCEDHVRSKGFAPTVSKIKGEMAPEMGGSDDTERVQESGT